MQIDSSLATFNPFAQSAKITKIGLDQPQNEINLQYIDEADQAYEYASKAVSEIVANDMKLRLEGSGTNLVERAMLLRGESQALLSSDRVEKTINAQNILLASRNQPPLKPAEEQAIASRIKAVAKERILFVDRLVSFIDQKNIKLSA